MSQSNQTEKVRDVYQLVTNRIIAHLENGVVPWKKTWTESGLPQNLITRKAYRGINLWLLSSLGYPMNFFLSLKQVKELGGDIKSGENPHMVVFWKRVAMANTNTEDVLYMPLLRYYKVFNVAQCTNLPLDKIQIVQMKNDPIVECEMIVQNMPKRPTICFGGDGPYYNPVKDYVNIPRINDFKNSPSYYETLFHELIHSTGSFDRLQRKEVMDGDRFGSEPYSQEELTAELGSCYLKSHAGLNEFSQENSASYIQSWLKKLKDDKRCIMYASVQAQRAVDFILNIKYDPIVLMTERQSEVF
ncbi:MAG: zincin-like metallopeptidase domain-containing protein [Bacteroidota bacterium]